MDSDDERDMDLDRSLDHTNSDHGDASLQDKQAFAISSLTGFLFGNIDEKGELEEDFLDEVI